jgi:hypothetical protein
MPYLFKSIASSDIIKMNPRTTNLLAEVDGNLVRVPGERIPNEMLVIVEQDSENQYIWKFINYSYEEVYAAIRSNNTIVRFAAVSKDGVQFIQECSCEKRRIILNCVNGDYISVYYGSNAPLE